MYKSGLINEIEFVAYMERMKKDNRAYRRLLGSAEYKTGRYINDIRSAFRSIEGIRTYIKKLNGQIRWKWVCKKFPITHLNEAQKDDINYFSEEKIIVYTSIFGNYDVLQEPIFVPDNCEFIVVTDQEIRKKTVWKKYDLSQIEGVLEGLSNVEKNRFCKMLPHVIFPDVEKTIYIDGNIKVITDLTEFINVKMPHGLSFHKHKARKCVYDEIKACDILRKAPRKELEAYRDYLQEEMFPKDFGMVECNVIVRDSANEEMRKIMNEWWEDFRTHSVKRDQLSMPYLLWKHDIAIDSVSNLGNNVAENDALRVVGHR